MTAGSRSGRTVIWSSPPIVASTALMSGSANAAIRSSARARCEAPSCRVVGYSTGTSPISCRSRVIATSCTSGNGPGAANEGDTTATLSPGASLPGIVRCGRTRPSHHVPAYCGADSRVMRMPGDRVLVTGSAGHLGEALVRVLRAAGRDVVGLDLIPSPFTTAVGSIADAAKVRACLAGVGAVLHPATLHKPHVGSHSRQDFVDTNITGTLTLLQEAVAAGVGSFVFTSTTSAFGQALAPAPGAPAAWITEEVTPVPRNIYGVTKAAAESLCELFHFRTGLPCLVLRTSRFFPEEDDDKRARESFDDANLKVNELLYRRGDIEDMVSAHMLALEKAPAIGFRRYIISATTPFTRDDLPELRTNPVAAVRRHVPEFEPEYAA